MCDEFSNSYHFLKQKCQKFLILPSQLFRFPAFFVQNESKLNILDVNHRISSGFLTFYRPNCNRDSNYWAD